MAKEPLTSKKYVDGIYIPAGLLILGTAITKRDWLPYAVVLTLALGVLKFIRTRKSIAPPTRSHSVLVEMMRHSQLAHADPTPPIEPKKALKPDIFQEYELKEKTILSHNTAM